MRTITHGHQAAPAGRRSSVDQPSAWISLDEHDGDLAVFLSYFAAAVRSVYPDVGRSTETLLRAPNVPSPSRLADSLLHDLIALPGPLILVLDDYHTIQTLDVDAVMNRLVQHMPAHVHLVLATRADPPLHLERLRGRQQFTELRGADLSFTTEEAGQLLRQMFGPTITDEITALLSESTEGWPAGLQLACISLRGRSDPTAFAKKIAQGNQPVVADYLLAEVLEGLPEAQRTGLLQTSLLDRLCAPLCDAVRGEASRKLAGEDFLHGVRQSNLFLKSLDDEGTWYRYHRHLPVPAAYPGAAILLRCGNQGNARPRQRLVRSSRPVGRSDRPCRASRRWPSRSSAGRRACAPCI